MFKAEPAYRFQFLKEQYYEPLERCNLLPIGLPAGEHVENVPDYCSRISGLLLIGGEDVNPQTYGEETNPRTHTLMPQRDKFEIEVIKECRRHQVPILGICRGLQILNVAHGGTLVQDLSHRPQSGNHRQEGELDFSTSHEVAVHPGTLLHQILGRERIITNTGHHQAVEKLGDGLTASAHAADGVIEAVEGPGFCLAVQWHPESWAADEVSGLIFEAFAVAARGFEAKSGRK
jgi:putative glutamine amidotransferase